MVNVLAVFAVLFNYGRLVAVFDGDFLYAFFCIGIFCAFDFNGRFLVRVHDGIYFLADEYVVYAVSNV